MRTCASEWKQCPGGRNDRRARPGRHVLGAVPYAPGFSPPPSSPTAAPAPPPQSGSLFPVVAAVGADFHRGFKCRRSGGRPKRHETLREPMERGQGRWNDRRPDVAAVSVAMPQRAKPPPLRPRAGFAPAPSPAPAPASASQSGSLFPWWQQLGALDRARTERRHALGPAEQANARRSSGRGARCPSEPPSCGSNTPTRIYHYSGTRYYGPHPQGRIYVRG